VVIKLKPGWAFEPDTGRVVHGGIGVLPALPPGARLLPVLDIPPPPRGWRRTPAEIELARYLQFEAPAGCAEDTWIDVVRGWSFVERVERAPS
jgi:hypothetical protein